MSSQASARLPGMNSTDSLDATFDPALDLVIERDLDVSPQHVWACWTDPAHLVQWFTPAPFGTESAEIDPVPGGGFHVVMRTPDGELMDQGTGCVLEAVENERFTWTSALGPDFRPLPAAEMAFTATVTMAPSDAGTRYRVVARHVRAEDKEQHEAMGFVEGWGAAIDQLVAHAKTF
jgi:uncharacterized protein YndB with AHSA1/START domain